MADLIEIERYENAVISLRDMTLTEVRSDDVIVHDLHTILDRIDELNGITITIMRKSTIESLE